MATCPACNHDVATPFFLNLDAWRWLVCPHCKARLEMKPPRSVVLGPIKLGQYPTVENLDSHKAGHYATGPLQMSPLARANTLETATVE